MTFKFQSDVTQQMASDETRAVGKSYKYEGGKVVSRKEHRGSCIMLILPQKWIYLKPIGCTAKQRQNRFDGINGRNKILKYLSSVHGHDVMEAICV